ncbi:porin [Noviherbaspirillum malthae]|jgi:predicted porin|uniref:porin n=1 Tax=Noviherbaspirillum malthae TaxID=1260987 RepID=UPI00188FFBCA|nr:porin [Noviherbaspirillum malthae]
MKKSLLALAVIGAFAGAAQAQTSVTIYGSIDAGLRYTNNADAAGNSRIQMGGFSNGNFNRNRIGFKGVEDLGGGMNAHFTLETGFNSGTGSLDNAANKLFNRSAFVGLGGAWGSLDLGRQYSVNFKTIALYDPFSYKFTSIVPLAGNGGLTWLDNDIQYTGTFGPITARAEWALGEVAGSTRNGATRAVGVGYSGGPFAAGASYTRRDAATTPAGAPFVDVTNWTVGGAFTTGPFRVAAGYAKQETDVAGGTNDVNDAWVGGSWTITPATQLTAGYYRTKLDAVAAGADVRRNTWIVGATYALSKRTNLYADIDRSSYTGAGNPATWGIQRAAGATFSNVTGVSIGVNHLF